MTASFKTVTGQMTEMFQRKKHSFYRSYIK